jgi:hypothetical protein
MGKRDGVDLPGSWPPKWPRDHKKDTMGDRSLFDTGTATRRKDGEEHSGKRDRSSTSQGVGHRKVATTHDEGHGVRVTSQSDPSEAITSEDVFGLLLMKGSAISVHISTGWGQVYTFQNMSRAYSPLTPARYFRGPRHGHAFQFKHPGRTTPRKGTHPGWGPKMGTGLRISERVAKMFVRISRGKGFRRARHKHAFPVHGWRLETGLGCSGRLPLVNREVCVFLRDCSGRTQSAQVFVSLRTRRRQLVDSHSLHGGLHIA